MCLPSKYQLPKDYQLLLTDMKTPSTWVLQPLGFATEQNVLIQSETDFIKFRIDHENRLYSATRVVDKMLLFNKNPVQLEFFVFVKHFGPIVCYLYK